MNSSRVSVVLLAVLWIVALVGAVGRFFIEWEWWDLTMALASLAFIVGLILTLARAEPTRRPLPHVAWLGQPDFWARAALVAQGFAVGCVLSVPAVLFRSLTLRLGQGGIAGGALFISGVLLYALPMALLAVKRYVGQAAGYFFLAVLVQYWVAFPA